MANENKEDRLKIAVEIVDSIQCVQGMFPSFGEDAKAFFEGFINHLKCSRELSEKILDVCKAPENGVGYEIILEALVMALAQMIVRTEKTNSKSLTSQEIYNKCVGALKRALITEYGVEIP